jgi:hypothetical protein
MRMLFAVCRSSLPCTSAACALPMRLVVRSAMVASMSRLCLLGRTCSDQGHEDPNAASSAEDQAAASGPPSQEEIDAAEAAVKQWGDYIRAMKEQGLNNKSPEVRSQCIDFMEDHKVPCKILSTC